MAQKLAARWPPRAGGIGWEFVDLRDGEGTTLSGVLVDPDRRCFIHPTVVHPEAPDDRRQWLVRGQHERAAFNMIKAGSLPPTEPGAYEHIA